MIEHLAKTGHIPCNLFLVLPIYYITGVQPVPGGEATAWTIVDDGFFAVTPTPDANSGDADNFNPDDDGEEAARTNGKISGHGKSSARRASTSSASSSRGGGGGGGGDDGSAQRGSMSAASSADGSSTGRIKTVMRRSPNKKKHVDAAAAAMVASPSPASSGVASSVAKNATASLDADAASFNPLVSMQTVIAGDMVSIKQRTKAAQQLATYFCELPTTPSLFTYYEPYLPILANVIVAPIKAAKEVQENAIKMMKALGSHSPRQCIEWCALHVSMQASHEPWHVEWCGGLILAAETRVPRIAASESAAGGGWDQRSMEYQEMEAAAAAVFHLWRSILDNVDDEAVVTEIAVHIKTLLCYEPTVGQPTWRAMVTSKIQPHFVDVADVFIGWAMSATTSKRLRDAIVALLHEMRDLWAGNSVFCLQLLQSFSNDIAAIYGSPTASAEDSVRLDSIILCCILVAQCVPAVALNTATGELGFLEKLLRSPSPARFTYSCQTVLRLSEYFVSVAQSHTELFSPLAMGAVRLLANQAASLLLTRRCESHDALMILSGAARLGKSCLPTVLYDTGSVMEAKNLLSDQVGGGSKPKRSVLELLLELRCFGATKYTTQMAIQAVVMVGFEGLQLVAETIDRKLRSPVASHISFWTTCLILSCNDPLLSSRSPSDHGVVDSTMKTLVSAIRSATSSAHAIEFGHVVLKLVPVFPAMLRKHFRDDCELDARLNDLLLEQARGCTRILESHASSSRVAREILSLLAWCLSKYPATLELPSDILKTVILELDRIVKWDDESTTPDVVKLLASATSFASRDRDTKRLVFQLAQFLMDDNTERGIPSALTTQVFSKLGVVAMETKPVPTLSSPSTWKCVWTASEMLVGDFERVFELLSQADCPDDQWYHVCRRIHARMGQSDASLDRISVLKNAVREAAKWIIQNRLRSPLGPPSAVFSGVERMLLQAQTSQRLAPSNQPTSPRTSAAMLVEFVLAMETLLGIVTDLKHPDAGSPESEAQKIQGFFRANVAVCEEWLSRIRPMLVDVSSSLRQTESVMHNNYATVATMAKKLESYVQRFSAHVVSDDVQLRVVKLAADSETAMFELAVSLCGLGDSDAVTGLHMWWVETLSRVASAHDLSSAAHGGDQWKKYTPSPWLHAVALEAELKYEEAVICYEAVIRHAMAVVFSGGLASLDALLHPLSPTGMSLDTLVGCIRRCGRCYAKLRQWTGLRNLHSRCWQFAEAMRNAYGRNAPSLQRLISLCDTWQIEDPVVVALSHQSQQVFHDAASLTASSPLLDERVAAAASASLQQWGALDPVDLWTAMPSTGLENLSIVVDQVRLLRFRPPSAFSQELLPTSGKEHESAMLHAALVGNPDTKHLLQIWSATHADYAVDATERARLHFASAISDRAKGVEPEQQTAWFLSMAHAARKVKNHAFTSLLLHELQTTVASYSTAGNLAISYEGAVLQMCGDTPREGFDTLVRLCSSAVRASGNSQEAVGSGDLHARALLRLARTLVNVEKCEMSDMVEAAVRVLGPSHRQPSDTSVVGCRDELAQLCLTSATAIAPANPRTWYEYSSWNHQQGKQTMDSVAANNGRLQLLAEEEEQLHSLVDQLRWVGAIADKEQVSSVFCHVMEGDVLLDNREQRLRRALPSDAADPAVSSLVDQLVALQTRAIARLLVSFKLAAAGYRSLLLAADTHDDTTGNDGRRHSSRVTSVALRLLRMLVRFGSEAQVADTVIDVFVSGPLAPWGRIVPQLLSRIGHSQQAISSSVSTLLVRLARQSPHLVAYPAVVESARRQKGHATESALLSDVLAELRNGAPDLTNGVERMVTELKRIAVLWDDAWVWALIKMAGDVNRRLSTLEKEAQRVDKNLSLSSKEKSQLARRKAVAIMAPVLVSIERLWNETVGLSIPGAILTPHEKLFVHKYSGSIAAAIAAFRNYCHGTLLSSAEEEGSPTDAQQQTPSSVWQPFADLLKTLLAAVGKRDRVDLAEISPTLARIAHKHKRVIMPGLVASSSSEAVTVTDFSRNVSILRTKTKPKCLKLVGSDGRVHRYLLKAREDLHLDERIMQFIGTVNEFLRADRFSSSRNLQSLNYSVVPLSSDSGLIQMVPEVLPLFQIYTSRVEDVGGASGNMLGPALAAVAGDEDEQAAQPQQQPPTAPFYAKLKQYGIHDVSPGQRARWPQSVLRRVHEELVAARPANVVHRELVLQSADFAETWTKMYRFSRSMAVTSVLGYIVGLGDRHLDNMLLSTRSGELLHIDYNVCFDKGRKLKVPEVVPFRLTPVMVDGLGLTGVDGVFRTAFVNTLRVVRHDDSREALLALLDAFVYDPLADWVGGSQAVSRDKKQRMEVNVNLSLFLSRARERSQETTTFMKTFATTCDSLTASMGRCTEWLGQNVLAQWRVLTELEQAKSLADEAVSKVEQEWDEVMAARPQENAELDAVVSRLTGDTGRLAAFANECVSRHTQIQQMQTKISTISLMDAAPVPSTVVGSLSRAHGRILSVAMRLPLSSHSTHVWTNMLASLEARCAGLDQQIPSLVAQTGHIIQELAPMLLSYKEKRSGKNTEDVYGVWQTECEQVLSLLQSGQHDNAKSVIAATLAKDQYAQGNALCSRERHEQLIHQLTQRIDQIGSAAAARDFQGDGEARLAVLAHQFLSQLSAMKLSNSQTQRVMKLINCRWILLSIDQVRTTDVQRNHTSGAMGHSTGDRLWTVAHVITILRELSSSSKGAMKKILSDAIARGLSSTDPEEPTDLTQAALHSVIAILASTMMIYNTTVEHITGGQCRSGGHASGPSGAKDAVKSAFQQLALEVQQVSLACDDLGLPCKKEDTLMSSLIQFQVEVESLTMDLSEPLATYDGDNVEGKASDIVARFLSHALVPTVDALLRRIVQDEWKLGAEVFRLGVSHVDTLALDAMPSLGGSHQVSPLADFQQCCATFTDLWAEWATQAAHVARQSAQDHQVTALTVLRSEHIRHREHLDWATPRSLDGIHRSDLLARVAHFSPAFPMIYEGIGRVESNLLEVAQQLEYVASQISFSAIVGISAMEIESELHAVCTAVQDAYNHVSRHFDLVRQVSDLAIAVNTVESSLAPVCLGVEGRDGDRAIESEADQVGRSLFHAIAAHLDRISAIRHASPDAEVVALKQKLEEARAEAAQAHAKLECQQATVDTLCEVMDPSNIQLHIHQLLQDATPVVELLHALGQAKSEPDTTSLPRRNRRATEESATRFVFAENARLLKILHRSVASVASMGELHNVLTDHEQQHGLLLDAANGLVDALQRFKMLVGSEAPEEKVDPRVIMDLLFTLPASATNGQPRTPRDLVSSTDALLQVCCQRFFDAARLADQFTGSTPLPTNASQDDPSTGELEARDSDLPADDDESDGTASDDVPHDALPDPADSDGNAAAEGSATGTSDAPPREPSATGHQERNRIGAEVVARIEEKLRGVIVESGSPAALSIDDQSTWLIRAATNVDNLCVMYEGWTPWI